MIRVANRWLIVAVCLGSAACSNPFGCKAETPDTATLPDSFVVAMETSRGPVEVMVRKAWAPLGAYRFRELVEEKHFDDARFFRVLKNFVAQFGLSGDPAVNARWDKRCITDEPLRHLNTRGTLSFAAARAPNSRSVHLFFNLKDNAQLDAPAAPYPPIGEVISGMEAIDSLYSGYGDFPPKSGPQYGREGPMQDSIAKLGNAYLARGWPKLDYIKTARVIRQWPAP